MRQCNQKRAADCNKATLWLEHIIRVHCHCTSFYGCSDPPAGFLTKLISTASSTERYSASVIWYSRKLAVFCYLCLWLLIYCAPVKYFNRIVLIFRNAPLAKPAYTSKTWQNHLRGRGSCQGSINPLCLLLSI